MTSSTPDRIDEALCRILSAGRLPDLASLPARAQGRMRARMREALAEAYCRGSDGCWAVVVRGDTAAAERAPDLLQMRNLLGSPLRSELLDC